MLKTIFFILSFLVVGESFAQAPIKSASPEDLIEKLNPNLTTNSQPSRTRGLRNITPEIRETPSVDLVINFEFNSVKLLPESKPLLDNLSKAMISNQLKPFFFIVEGHTDSVGTPEYNLKLSYQRAVTVIHYLSSKGVSMSRIKAIGKGASELLLIENPEAAENRRVRIKLDY